MKSPSPYPLPEGRGRRFDVVFAGKAGENHIKEIVIV